jgi:hypothetical protein
MRLPAVATTSATSFWRMSMSGSVGRILDPLFRRYFSDEFAVAMDEHARTEFALLRDHLAEPRRTC